MAEAGGSSAAAGGNDGSKVIGVIGDEDTVCGFLLAGVGQKDAKGTNFLVVGASAWSARSTTGLFLRGRGVRPLPCCPFLPF